jgi:hypothetical protein
MRLSLKVFGFEIASLDFESDEPEKPSVVDRGIKGMSRWWVKGMAR